MKYLVMFLVMLFTIPLSSQEDNNSLTVDDPLELVQVDYSTPDLFAVDASFKSIEDEFHQSYSYHNNYLESSSKTNFDYNSNIPIAPDIHTNNINYYNINVTTIGNNNIINTNLNTGFRTSFRENTNWYPNIGF